MVLADVREHARESRVLSRVARRMTIGMVPSRQRAKRRPKIGCGEVRSQGGSEPDEAVQGALLGRRQPPAPPARRRGCGRGHPVAGHRGIRRGPEPDVRLDGEQGVGWSGPTRRNRPRGRVPGLPRADPGLEYLCERRSAVHAMSIGTHPGGMKWPRRAGTPQNRMTKPRLPRHIRRRAPSVTIRSSPSPMLRV